MTEDNKQGRGPANRSIIAIIPARGGSKGLPRKNVLPVAGKPLIAWSIEAARASGYIGRVMVATDDREIASISEAYGAHGAWRPPGISGDTASSESVLLYVLDSLKEDAGHEPDLVVFLQATSPLRRSGDIDDAVRTLDERHADSLFSACRSDRFTWTLTERGVKPTNYDPARRPRRQEIGKATMEENGSIYIFKPWVIRKCNSRLGGVIVVYVMPRLYSFEIDDREDMELIDSIMRAQNGKLVPREHAQSGDDDGREG